MGTPCLVETETQGVERFAQVTTEENKGSARSHLLWVTAFRLSEDSSGPGAQDVC